MKKYLKSFPLFLIFSFLFIACNTAEHQKSKEGSVSSGKKTADANPTISLELYPEKLAKNVNLKLDSLLKRIHKRHDFHGAILVAKNNKIVYKNQIGYADFGKKLTLKEESAFQLASVSKQFTAAAIMILNERNLIKLSDTINTYFPDFPYKNVTIKNLLNHTAGLPKYFWVAEHKWKEKNPPTNGEMMELMTITNTQRFFKPGSNFDYSNTAYFVLASIIEKVSGISFSDFLKINIFDPLGMTNSYVYSFQSDVINENQLNGYRLYKGRKHIKISNTVNDAIVGDKNVYSTINDLFRWTYGLNSGQILSKQSLDLMYSMGEIKNGKKVPYGLGFRIDIENQKNIYHYGKWNGFSTGINNYLEDNLVVIVLEHTSYRGIKLLNQKIKDIVSQNLII